jgi:hypothetical protein
LSEQRRRANSHSLRREVGKTYRFFAESSTDNTGFAGPATGRHHDEYVKEFTEQIEHLLTEPGG